MNWLQRISGRLSSATPVNLAWRLDSGPLCTFTFDDCPTSAWRVGGAKLQSVGAHGTFYVSAQLTASALDKNDPLLWGEDLVSVRSAGHEIGCHTYSHRSAARLSPLELRREFDANLQAIRTVLPGIDLVTFAYPYGEVSVHAKHTVAGRFGVARGVRRGLNGRMVDLSELRAICLNSRTFDRARISHLVSEAVRRKAWLVFLAHDIRASASPWGCTPDEFEFAVDEVERAGMEILTMRSALGRITHRTHG